MLAEYSDMCRSRRGPSRFPMVKGPCVSPSLGTRSHSSSRLAVGFFPGLRDLQQSTSLGFECRSGLLGGGGSTVNAMALPGAAAPMETV